MNPWLEAVTEHWERAPVRARAGGPRPSPERVFRLLVTASAPFRAGTRFFVLPNVRFFVDEARDAAPAELLPGAGDAAFDGYLTRVAQRLAPRPFRLFVEQPLMLDFPLWDDVRSMMAAFFERVGWPLMPVVTDVSLGHGASTRAGQRDLHSVLTFVLAGRTRMQLSDSHGGTTMEYEAEAGDVFYWPSTMSLTHETLDHCLSMRLSIPTHASHTARAVKTLVADLLQELRGEEHPVPYIPVAPAPRADGSLGPLEPLAHTARALEKLVSGPALARALRLRWAKRVSAACLEPVPPLGERRTLSRGDIVRPAARGSIVRMKHAPSEWIWAILGRAFSVSDHPVATRLFDALLVDASWRVGDMCSTKASLALLQKVCDLRGVHVVRSATPRGLP